MDASRNVIEIAPNGVGPLLRRWRESRHLSQLGLALEAEVSARHISFVETGRATPSREMLLTLSNVLDVPLRERNVLLQAAGYAPIYRETRLDDPRMAQVRTALDLIMKQHEPRSAVAFDRHWNLVMVNGAFVQLITLALGHPIPDLEPMTILDPPKFNLLKMLFDPEGVRRLIVNWEPLAKALLNEAHQSASWARDETMQRLIAEVLAYPGVPPRWREPDLETPQALMLPFEMKIGDTVARFFSTITTLGKPQDVTLQELHIESFYPADAVTEALTLPPA